MKKERGNIADLMAVGLYVLAMVVVMLSFMDSMAMIGKKEDVGQLARKYILRMETTGGLNSSDQAALVQELHDQGVTDIDLSGTTYGSAGYGEPIALEIHGKLGGNYAFTEKRVSTAKY